MADNRKSVVITGATRGVGFFMAKEFLEHGNNVTICGTSEDNVKAAAGKLDRFSERVQAVVCDVTKYDELIKLSECAREKWGQIDIWINNAGINQPQLPVWEVTEKRIEEIVSTNITGTIYGSKIAANEMITQGFGALYNMQGWGSNGRHMDSLNIYGTTKNAVHYFTAGLAGEAKKFNIIVGTLSPGMMVTDFILGPLKKQQDTPGADSRAFERFKKAINLIAEKPEVVAAFLVKKMLSNRKNDVDINYLTGKRIIGRLVRSIFVKRDLLVEIGFQNKR